MSRFRQELAAPLALCVALSALLAVWHSHLPLPDTVERFEAGQQRSFVYTCPACALSKHSASPLGGIAPDQAVLEEVRVSLLPTLGFAVSRLTPPAAPRAPPPDLLSFA